MSGNNNQPDTNFFSRGNDDNPFISSTGADIFGDAQDSRAVVEPYYSEIIKQVEEIEKDLVLLSQSAIVYFRSCTNTAESCNMTRVLHNLLDEHKLQMKVVECAHSTFCMK